MKIAIMGYSGSGKSTLAKQLARELNIEPLYLDRVHFQPNWIEREPEAAREIVRREMAKPGWVIDGNYTHLLREERMREARRLLCETGLDIQAISQAVGYGNRGNFSTAFRERFGMAPTALRQEQDPHA